MGHFEYFSSFHKLSVVLTVPDQLPMPKLYFLYEKNRYIQAAFKSVNVPFDKTITPICIRLANDNTDLKIIYSWCRVTYFL